MASLEVLRLLERELNQENYTIYNLENQLKKSFERRKSIIESIISLSKTIVDASKVPKDTGSSKTSAQRNGPASSFKISRRRKALRAVMRKYLESKHEGINERVIYKDIRTRFTRKYCAKLLMRPVVELEVLKDIPAVNPRYSASIRTDSKILSRVSKSPSSSSAGQSKPLKDDSRQLACVTTPCDIVRNVSSPTIVNKIINSGNSNHLVTSATSNASAIGNMIHELSSSTTDEDEIVLETQKVNNDVWLKSESMLIDDQFNETAEDPLDVDVDVFSKEDYNTTTTTTTTPNVEPSMDPSNTPNDAIVPDLLITPDVCAPDPSSMLTAEKVFDCVQSPSIRFEQLRESIRASKTRSRSRGVSGTINPFAIKHRIDSSRLRRHRLYKERQRLEKLPSQIGSIEDKSQIICYI